MPRRPSPTTADRRAAFARHYPHFVRALLALGKTRPARAEALVTDVNTVDRLLERLPESVALLGVQPQLLRALADDLEAQQEK